MVRRVNVNKIPARETSSPWPEKLRRLSFHFESESITDHAFCHHTTDWQLRKLHHMIKKNVRGWSRRKNSNIRWCNIGAEFPTCLVNYRATSANNGELICRFIIFLHCKFLTWEIGHKKTVWWMERAYSCVRNEIKKNAIRRSSIMKEKNLFLVFHNEALEIGEPEKMGHVKV